MGISTSDNLIKERTPFYLHGEDVYVIKNFTEIESDFLGRPSLRYVEPAEPNIELNALKQLSAKLVENKIKIIFFTTPKARVYFDNLSEENNKTFSSILDSLSKDGFTIYRLDDKYADHNIWYDYRHIVINQRGIEFSEDVSQFVIDTIKN